MKPVRIILLSVAFIAITALVACGGGYVKHQGSTAKGHNHGHLHAHPHVKGKNHHHPHTHPHRNGRNHHHPR